MKKPHITLVLHRRQETRRKPRRAERMERAPCILLDLRWKALHEVGEGRCC